LDSIEHRRPPATQRPERRQNRTVDESIISAERRHRLGLNLTVQASATSWGWSLGLVLATPACTGS
jgi:hypothetical protein